MPDLKVYLYQALAAEKGIRLRSPEPQRLITRLQDARKVLADPALKSLVITLSRIDPEGEVWIVKKGAEAAVSESTNAEEE